MNPRLTDTRPEAEKIQIEILRSMPAYRKFALVDSMWQTTRELAQAGLRKRHPQATEEEIRYRWAALVLDRETMINAFGWNPSKEEHR